MLKAILTGHSRGLGAALAANLLSRGIATLGLSRKTLSSLGQSGDLLSEVEIDLADDVALRKWLAGQALHQFIAGADTILLINNAGIVQPIGPSESQDLGLIAKAVSLNVTAPLTLMAALAALRGKAELRVTHISSGAGRKGYAGWNIYCATKAALDHHARAALEDNSAGIRICSLAPGIIDTDMQQELRDTAPEKFPLHADFVALKNDGVLARPADAAAKMVSYILSDKFGNEPVADIRQIEI